MFVREVMVIDCGAPAVPRVTHLTRLYRTSCTELAFARRTPHGFTYYARMNRRSYPRRLHTVLSALLFTACLFAGCTTQQASTAPPPFVAAVDGAPTPPSSPAQDPQAWLLAFVDIETTGLVPGWHEMIDIGVVMTDLEGRVIDSLFMRIQPNHPERLSDGARRVNAFNPARWRSLGALDGVTAVQRLTEFHRRVARERPTLMVAFNSQFDAAFLDHLFRASGSTWRTLYHYFVLDVPSMAWALGLQDLTNGDLARQLGLADEPRVAEEHTGLTGAMLNTRIYQALRQRRPTPEPAAAARLTTLAFRVHHMARMEAFYTEAFGFVFRDEQTGAITSRFGRAGELTIKLVPIRGTTDFVDFPVHQPGFEVADVEHVIANAEKHGGVRLQSPTRDGAFITASVRDPDGNTVELYQRQ